MAPKRKALTEDANAVRLKKSKETRDRKAAEREAIANRYDAAATSVKRIGSVSTTILDPRVEASTELVPVIIRPDPHYVCALMLDLIHPTETVKLHIGHDTLDAAYKAKVPNPAISAMAHRYVFYRPYSDRPILFHRVDERLNALSVQTLCDDADYRARLGDTLWPFFDETLSFPRVLYLIAIAYV